MYKAAKKYDIPRSTINNHLLNRNIGFKIGRPPQFSKAQEQLIVKLLITFADYGFPVKKKRLRSISNDFAIKYDIKRNGEAWIPGEDWLVLSISMSVLKYKQIIREAKNIL